MTAGNRFGNNIFAKLLSAEPMTIFSNYWAIVILKKESLTISLSFIIVNITAGKSVMAP
jgi:hypothetical protein